VLPNQGNVELAEEIFDIGAEFEEQGDGRPG
jgi:hypothetical protein